MIINLKTQLDHISTSEIILIVFPFTVYDNNVFFQGPKSYSSVVLRNTSIDHSHVLLQKTIMLSKHVGSFH